MKTLNTNEIEMVSGAGLLSSVEGASIDITNGLEGLVEDTGSTVNSTAQNAASILDQARGLGVQAVDNVRYLIY